MKHLILSFVFLLFAVPAKAGEWWTVYGSGVKPHRNMIFADESSWDKSVDFSASMASGAEITIARLTVYEIFESATGPDRKISYYQFNCTTHLVMVEYSNVIWRDEGRQQRLDGSTWHPIPSQDDIQQIATFACDESSHNAQQGMAYVTSGLNPADATWDIFWKDGKRPPYTSTKSNEQIARENAANLKSARASLSGMAEVAGAQMNTIVEDERKAKAYNDDQKRRQSVRPKSKADYLLVTWIGRSESALVASWGIPKKNYSAVNARFLNYSPGFNRNWVNQESGVVVGSESFYCDITFEIRDGKVIDFKAHGNYCSTVASNSPSGIE